MELPAELVPVTLQLLLHEICYWYKRIVSSYKLAIALQVLWALIALQLQSMGGTRVSSEAGAGGGAVVKTQNP